MQNNKVSTYLFYALGEILLVVIGILIALGLNSQHQNKQNEEYITTILKQIQTELEVDIIDAIRIAETYFSIQQVAKKVLTNSWTVDDYVADEDYQMLRRTYVSFTTNNSGYNQLMNNLEIMPEKFKPLVKELNMLYIELQDDIDGFNTKLRVDAEYESKKTLERFPQAYQWYMDNSTGRRIEAEQFFKDPYYPNQVLNHYTNLEQLVDGATGYRFIALSIHQKIDSMLNVTNAEVPDHLKVMGDINGELDIYLGEYKNETTSLTVSKDKEQLQMHIQFIESGEELKAALWRHSDSRYFANFNGTILFHSFGKKDDIPLVSLDRINFTEKPFLKVNDER
ncbi:MAG: hypothetical protein ACI82Q_002350 [Nonlabens sp.]|jgi:hypothetical protein